MLYLRNQQLLDCQNERGVMRGVSWVDKEGVDDDGGLVCMCCMQCHRLAFIVVLCLYTKMLRGKLLLERLLKRTAKYCIKNE